MKLGIDISTYLDELKHGAVYYDGNTQIDPLERFRANGVEYVRIRLWNNPHDPAGRPYLGGDCDIDCFLSLAKLAAAKGFKLLLDLHYSDFWADPGKQFIPKAWQSFELLQLESAVYSYTRDTLLRICAEGIDVALVQIGNEITNGMLWPIGRLVELDDGTRSNYEALCRLISAGTKAVREVIPSAGIILHLERSNDRMVYNEFFSNMQKYNVDYDIIGASYYPYWHGTFSQLFDNLASCRRFNKRIIIVEVGYGFTLENYILQNDTAARLVIDRHSADSFEQTFGYPLSPSGQAAFVRDFLRLSQKNGIDSVFYWEPLWIPKDGICWASEAGLNYINEIGKSTSNEWANQCLFDYRGRKLPAFEEYHA